MKHLRQYIRQIIKESTEFDANFKQLMDSGYEGMIQAIELAENMDIPTQDLPWTAELVLLYVDYHHMTVFGRRSSGMSWDKEVEQILEPTGWTWKEYEHAWGRRDSAQSIEYQLAKSGWLDEQLSQYTGQVLLTEGMKTIDDLPTEVYINIVSGRSTIVYYSKPDPNNNGQYIRTTKKDVPLPWGMVKIKKVEEEYGECEGAYSVAKSMSAKGWGPLLYDVAMEWATSKGTGLISDRIDVTPEAVKIWDFYLNNRESEEGIYITQLTNLNDGGNCDQDVAGGDWKNSSLSKMYSKVPNILNSKKVLK